MRRSESLKDLLKKCTPARCEKFFRGMSESDRRGMAPQVLAVVKANTGEFGALDPGLVALALATANARELHRADVHVWSSAGKSILMERRPAWLQKWADEEIAGGPGAVHFLIEMVEHGLIQRPEHNNYIIGHIEYWGYRGRDLRLADRLRDNSEFCEGDLWRLFELDGTSDCSLAGNDKYSHVSKCWGDALWELAVEDVVPRARLLDASLDALDRDFIQFRASWYSRFHELLEPTSDERLERVDRYLHLLGSSIAPTVSFAMKALTVLDRIGHVPVDGLLEALPPVLFAKAKGTVGLAIRLMKSAHKSAPERRAEIAALAAQGLMHPAIDVQKEILDFLEVLDAKDECVVDAIRECADLIAPSLRPRLVLWIGESDVEVEPTTESPAPKVPEGVTPVADRGELLSLLALVIEDPNDPIQVERAIDGIARYSANGVEETALRKRALKLLPTYQWDPKEDAVGLGMCRLVLEWLHSPIDLRGDSLRAIEGKGSTADFFLLRLSELGAGHTGCDAAEGTPTFGTLSLPTDTRGWIAPKELVDRSLRLKVDSVVGAAEQVLAILRLGPKGRQAELARANGVDGEFGQALRYALGAGEVVIGKSCPLWIAAARARSPRQDAPRIDESFPGTGAGGALACSGEVETRRHEHQHGAWHRIHLVNSAPSPLGIPTLHPVVRLNQDRERKYGRGSAAGGSEALVRWSATFAPGCTEDYFGAGFRWLDVDWSEAQWEVRHFFHPMLFAEVDLGPNAYRLMALGLAAKESGQWGMAVDCALSAIADGRFEAPKLGRAFAELLTGGAITPGRWARSLEELARASRSATTLVCEVFRCALRGDPTLAPKGPPKFLELMFELHVEVGLRVDDEQARAFLEGIGVGGKTATLCRKLLAL